MAEQEPGVGGNYPDHNLTVTTFPRTTIHPNEIKETDDKLFGGIVLALLSLPTVGGWLGFGRTVASLIGILGVSSAVRSKGQDPYVAYPFRFQVTEFKYLMKKPTSTNAGFAIYRVYDEIKGKSYELERVVIAKTGA